MRVRLDGTRLNSSSITVLPQRGLMMRAAKDHTARCKRCRETTRALGFSAASAMSRRLVVDAAKLVKTLNNGRQPNNDRRCGCQWMTGSARCCCAGSLSAACMPHAVECQGDSGPDFVDLGSRGFESCSERLLDVEANDRLVGYPLRPPITPAEEREPLEVDMREHPVAGRVRVRNEASLMAPIYCDGRVRCDDLVLHTLFNCLRTSATITPTASTAARN